MNSKWQELRSSFPVLEKRPFLNTAFAGLIHPKVEEQLSQTRKAYMENMSHFRLHAFEEMKEEARNLVANMLGVASNNVALLHNFSSGMNTIVQNLPDKQVMMMKDEYPSLHLPFESAGFDITLVGNQSNGEVSYAEIEEAIAKSRPPYFAISQVHYNSGWCVDLGRIAEITNAHGSKLIVDGTQAFGAIHTDLSEIKVDAYLASTYKWFMGGYGAGIGFISDKLLADFSFCMASQNNLVFDDDGKPHYREGIKMLEQGHKDHEVIARLLEAMKISQNLGFKEVEERIVELNLLLAEGLSDLGIELIGNGKDFTRKNLLCIPMEKEIALRLEEADIDCSIRGKAIRFSVHAYNNESDIQKVITALS
jgi:selenocysteine lyase/cysteine desulfurase